MDANHWSGLDLRRLIALRTIADSGSFWAAADRLDCSASALSQQIAGLEQAVGHRLLERSRGRRRVLLTEPGRLLVKHAEAIVARLEAARADLQAFGEGRAGRIRVGTYQSVGTKVLPRLLREFALEWPAVELQLTEEAEDELLLRRVERGDLDLSFTVLPLLDGPFESNELMRDPYALAVAADDALATMGPPGLEALAGLKLIGFQGCRSMAHTEAYLRSQGIEPDVTFRSDDNGIVQALVAAGMGAALMPLLALNEKDETIRILELRSMPPRRLALAWHRDRYRSPAVNAFIRRAGEICAEIEARGLAVTA
ncbi:MAG: LysR family transcriptional regulator [Candidatus Dormibacteraceae bacterium]